jgi:single stranded DNA-binding protein
MFDVHLTGTIGQDPELKNPGGDSQYCSVGVATEKFVGDGKGDMRDGQATNRVTTWVNVKVFRATAKFVCDKFRKGDKIVVRGEMEISKYEKKDRDSGQVIDPAAISISVLASSVEGPYRVVKNDERNGEAQAQGQTQSQAPARAAAPARQAAPTRPAPAAAPKQAVAPKAGPAPVDDDIPFALILPFILPLTAAIAGGLSLLA